MFTAIVALEGVLKTETGNPIPEGIQLYRILVEHYRIVISSDLDPEVTEHWLRSHLIVGYADIYDNRSFFEGQELRRRHLDLERSRGKVSLFVDPDADNCAYALACGITTVMFASPKFVRVSRDVKPWEDLKNEVERQRLALLEAHVNNTNRRFE